MRKLAVLLSALCITAGVVNGQNLLLNGDFNSPASGAWPDSWSGWQWNAGFANHENLPAVTYDGSYYVVVGNNWYDGGGGFYQTVAATAGMEYNLNVLSGADAWWLPTGRMTMFFQDSSGAELLRAERNTVDPAVYGDNYDIAHPWASYSLTATAPDNTTQIKVEFASNNPGGVGGSIWFENAVLTQVPEPGAAALLALGSALLLGYRSRRNAARA